MRNFRFSLDALCYIITTIVERIWLNHSVGLISLTTADTIIELRKIRSSSVFEGGLTYEDLSDSEDNSAAMTREEFDRAVDSMKKTKSPGPDEIPAEVW